MTWLGVALVVACDREAPDSSVVPAAQDILTTDLALDLGALTGRASIVVMPATGDDAVTLEVGGLDVTAVTVDGAAVDAAITGGVARVPVAQTETPVTVTMDYGFDTRTVRTFDGWMPGLGVSFLWPNYCSNLFPCNSSPTDGVLFTMDVTGFDPALTAIYPTTTVSDAPSYMPGIAVGDYEEVDLGATGAGTTVSAWYLRTEPNAQADARAGTAHLVDAVDFFETTYGPYAFGLQMGTVQVNWGGDSWGGMEHHPFFHVAKWDFGNEEAQVHEAAHGWFGDGVRLACWEDFVLSEGTTTYITARALEQVDGPDEWPMYVDDFLVPSCTGADVNTIVLPDDTCNVIDFENDPLWSLATYMKGACFYEEVGDRIGPDVLDEAISDFYRTHVNRTGRMRDMIDTIEAHADPADADAIEASVTDWLLTEQCPVDYAARCRAHQR